MAARKFVGMKTFKSYTILKWFFYILEFFVFYSIEQIPGLSLPVLGVRPLLLIPAFSSCVMFEKEYGGIVLGVVCGILVDISFGTPIGGFTLLLCIVGYVFGVLTGYFLKINIWNALMLDFFVVSLCVTCKFLIEYCFRGTHQLFCMWVHYCFPLFIYSTFVVIPIFLLNRKFIYSMSAPGGE